MKTINLRPSTSQRFIILMHSPLEYVSDPNMSFFVSLFVGKNRISSQPSAIKLRRSDILSLNEAQDEFGTKYTQVVLGEYREDIQSNVVNSLSSIEHINAIVNLEY